jgi:hypothetical protein
MASVVLSDLIQREQFQTEILRQTLEKMVFWQAGVIAADGELSRLMQANVGSTFEFDYFLDIDAQPNISDDSDTRATPNNITTGTDRAVGNYRNLVFGAKSITANLSSTGDPMTAIAGRIAPLWARLMDKNTLSIVTGLLADNVANDGGDMVNEQSGTPVDIGLILNTIQTAGDAADELFTSMVCHSMIRTKLRLDGVTDKIYSDSGQYLYEALAGLRLIVRDGVETGAPAAGDYTSYILGGSFMGYGEGAPKRPNAIQVDELSGNGAGEEVLVNRKNYSIHPYGFSFTGTPASTSPTDAEFADGTNWDRTAERKAIPLAALRCSAQ